jgi:hypothetical protein
VPQPNENVAHTALNVIRSEQDRNWLFLQGL